MVLKFFCIWFRSYCGILFRFVVYDQIFKWMVLHLSWSTIHLNFFPGRPFEICFSWRRAFKIFYRFYLPPRSLIIVPLLKRPNMPGPAIFGSFKNLAQNAEPAISTYFGMPKMPGNCRQCQKFSNPWYVCLPRLKIELIQSHLVRENLCKKFLRNFYPLFYRKIGLNSTQWHTKCWVWSCYTRWFGFGRL